MDLEKKIDYYKKSLDAKYPAKVEENPYTAKEKSGFYRIVSLPFNKLKDFSHLVSRRFYHITGW